MKRVLAFSSLAAVFALFVVLTAQSADTFAPTPCRPVSHESIKTYQNEDFDLSSCERICRRRFGYEPGMADVYELHQNQPYWAYAQCIDDCNKTFWKEFDRKTSGSSGGN
jgi:hypothetical protein